MLQNTIIQTTNRKSYLLPCNNNTTLSSCNTKEITYSVFRYKYLFSRSNLTRENGVTSHLKKKKIEYAIQELHAFKQTQRIKKKSFILYISKYLQLGYLRQYRQDTIPIVQITGTRTNIFLNCYLPETNSTFTWHLGAFWKHWFRQGPSPILYAFAKHSLMRLIEVQKLSKIRLIFRNLPVYKQRKLLYAMRDRRLQITYLSRESSQTEIARVFNGIKLKHKRRKHLRQRQAFIKPFITPTRLLPMANKFIFAFASDKSSLFQFKSKPVFFFKLQKHLYFLVAEFKLRAYRYALSTKKLRFSRLSGILTKKLKYGRFLAQVHTHAKVILKSQYTAFYQKALQDITIFSSFRYIPQGLVIKFNYNRWIRKNTPGKLWKQQKFNYPRIFN